MIGTIVFLVSVIVVWIVIFKIIKSVFIFRALFRIISVFLLLFLAVLIVTGLAVLNDANDFRKNFTNSTNLFLLENNGTLLSGVVLNSQSKEPFQILETDKLIEIQTLYNKSKTDNLTKSYYKVFVINMKALENIPEYSIKDQNMDLNKSEINKILLSDNAKKDFADIAAIKQHVSADQVIQELNADDNKLKGYLFSYSLNYFFNPKNIDKFFTELKNGNINVYDETAMFKAIKFVPKFMISDLIKNPTNNTLIQSSLNSVSLNTLV